MSEHSVVPGSVWHVVIPDPTFDPECLEEEGTYSAGASTHSSEFL